MIYPFNNLEIMCVILQRKKNPRSLNSTYSSYQNYTKRQGFILSNFLPHLTLTCMWNVTFLNKLTKVSVYLMRQSISINLLYLQT